MKALLSLRSLSSIQHVTTTRSQHQAYSVYLIKLLQYRLHYCMVVIITSKHARFRQHVCWYYTNPVMKYLFSYMHNVELPTLVNDGKSKLTQNWSINKIFTDGPEKGYLQKSSGKRPPAVVWKIVYMLGAIQKNLRDNTT